MNLFILDRDPVKAAQLNCDKHVRKIILEAAQMLGCTHFLRNPDMLPQWIVNQQWLRGKSHQNNHITRWVRESKDNYIWTAKHGIALCEEYTYRHPDSRRHKTQRELQWFMDNVPDLPAIGLTPFRQAVAEECKQDDPVQAYVDYYNKCKAHFAVWTKRPTPEWFVSPLAGSSE